MRRVEVIVSWYRGFAAVRGDAALLEVASGSVVYIDPPYVGTQGYGHSLDYLELAHRHAAAGSTVWVSEGKPVSDEAVELHRVVTWHKRSTKPRGEWLSVLRPRG